MAARQQLHALDASRVAELVREGTALTTEGLRSRYAAPTLPPDLVVVAPTTGRSSVDAVHGDVIAADAGADGLTDTLDLACVAGARDTEVRSAVRAASSLPSQDRSPGRPPGAGRVGA